jgi:hypothetical protein
MYIFLTSALVGGGWSASSPGHFTSGERGLGTHWIWDYLGARISLEAVDKEKIIFPSGICTRPLSCPALSSVAIPACLLLCGHYKMKQAYLNRVAAVTVRVVGPESTPGSSVSPSHQDSTWLSTNFLTNAQELFPVFFERHSLQLLYRTGWCSGKFVSDMCPVRSRLRHWSSWGFLYSPQYLQANSG